MDNKFLGETIRIARKAKGLTQEALAEIVDIDEKHLSRIENGKSFPSLITLKKLLLALDLSFTSIGMDMTEQKHVNNPAYIKALQILNSAESDIQLDCYLDVLMATSHFMGKFQLSAAGLTLNSQPQ